MLTITHYMCIIIYNTITPCQAPHFILSINNAFNFLQAVKSQSFGKDGEVRSLLKIEEFCLFIVRLTVLKYSNHKFLHYLIIMTNR